MGKTNVLELKCVWCASFPRSSSILGASRLSQAHPDWRDVERSDKHSHHRRVQKAHRDEIKSLYVHTSVWISTWIKSNRLIQPLSPTHSLSPSLSLALFRSAESGLTYTQSEMGVDGESGWRVVMTSQTVGRLPALSRPARDEPTDTTDNNRQVRMVQLHSE